MKLNPRQRRFAEFYCGEHLGNAEQSAIAAGYSKNYARGCAYKLLENDGIKAYIDGINDKAQTEAVATRADIKTFWSNIMNDEGEEMKNRLRASELLAKADGMFNNDW